MFSTQRKLRKAAVIALSECTVFKLLVKLLAPYKIFISSIHRVEHFILFQLASSTKIGDLVDSSDWGDIQVKLQRRVLDTIAKKRPGDTINFLPRFAAAAAAKNYLPNYFHHLPKTVI